MPATCPHEFFVPRGVGRAADHLGDDGADKDDGDDTGGDEPPRGLPVDAGPDSDHTVDVLSEPARGKTVVHMHLNMSRTCVLTVRVRRRT